MKHSAAIDLKARLSISKNSSKLRVIRSFRSNTYLSTSIRALAALKLFLLPSYTSRVHNYCIFTSRSRSIINEFKVSRFVFKRLSSFGFLNGVKRSSW